MAVFEMRNARKAFGALEVLKGVSLKVEKGEVVSIIGPSGGGKSTMLRCATLLETMDSGTLAYGENIAAREENGKSVYAGKAALAQVRRQFGLVFQQFDLFPHYTVLKNVCYPLEIAGVGKAEAKKRAQELLELVGLSDRAGSYPSQLSGGQKQRVAIARAMATNPKYLLCDEATSALDPTTTESILQLLKQINRTMGVTIVVITHEMRVIDQICDRVAVIDNSHIAESGRVSQVFSNPQSEIARRLILPQGGPVDRISGNRRLRLVFEGSSSHKPVISDLVLACQAPVNILFADMRDLDGKAYGHMILELPDQPRQQEKLLAWLDSNRISYEEA